MSNIKIAELKTEYLNLVLENEAKYNPDYDLSLNDEEIGLLMTDKGLTSEDELVQSGLMVERTIKAQESRTSEGAHTAKTSKEIAKVQENINKYAKELEILKEDMKNGTTKGASCIPLSSKQSDIAGSLGITALITTTLREGYKGFKADDVEFLFKGFGLFPGCFAGLLTFGVTVGGMALYNQIQKKNPDSSFSKRYLASLPQRIENLEQKLNKEKQKLSELTAQ